MKRRQNTSAVVRNTLALSASVPLLALAERHGEADMHRLGDGVGVERVHDQRLGELMGGAGELRQHQHARIVVGLGGDVFLGHQVHAVAQRRHHADAADAVEARQGRARRRPRRVAQRRPVELREAAVDAAGQPVELGAQLAVFVDLLARTRADLQEVDLAAMFGMRSSRRP